MRLLAPWLIFEESDAPCLPAAPGLVEGPRRTPPRRAPDQLESVARREPNPARFSPDAASCVRMEHATAKRWPRIAEEAAERSELNWDAGSPAARGANRGEI